jgi:hypothetical protein
MQLIVKKELFTKVEVNMTTYGHVKGSERSHNKSKEIC